jgi:CBASS immunity sensor of nucleotide second messenger signals
VLPSPSLLEPQSIGGDVAESGFSFQASYVLTCLCRWLSHDGFTSMVREAMGDVEASFFVPGRGFERELVEVKNYQLTPVVFWNELRRFQQLDSGSPGSYRLFTLASPGLSKELRPLSNGLRRIRGPAPFYDQGSAIFQRSFDDFSARVERLGGKRQDTLFLFEKVELVSELIAHQSQGEALFKQAFIECFPEYQDVSARVLQGVYDNVKKLIQSRKNQTIFRKEVEEGIREKIPLTQLPTLRPVLIYTASGSFAPTNNTEDARAQALFFDWTDFAGEAVPFPSASVWNDRLMKELERTRQWLQTHRIQRRIRLSGGRRLCASLAIGACFSAVRGFTLEIEYRGEIYASDAHPDASTPEYDWSVSHVPGTGDTLVVTIGVLREIREDVDVFMHTQEGRVLPAVHLFGREPFLSAPHANRAVGYAKRIIAEARSQTQATRIALFLSGPNYFALFLGHRLNAIAPIQCYQFTDTGQYTPACLLFS